MIELKPNYIISLLLFLGISSVGVSQSTSINKIDSQKKRQGEWTIYYDAEWHEIPGKDSAEYYRIITYNNDVPVGVVKDYFKDGTLQFEGRMIKDRPDAVMDGDVTWYWQSGIYAECTYAKGVLKDSVRLFDAEGEKINQTWEALKEKYSPLMESESYQEASEILEVARAWSEINNGKESEHYLESIFHLGNCYYYIGDFDKTAPLFKEGAKLFGKLYGMNSASYAIMLNNLGKVYLYQNNFHEARKVLSEALKIIIATEGKTNLHYAMIAAYLARALKNTGSYARAESLYHESMEIQYAKKATNSELYGETLNNLAALYTFTGDYKKAERYYVAARDVRLEVLGEKHADYLQTLHGLATTYRFLGNSEAALPVLFACRDGRKKKLGEQHEDYQLTLMMIGLVYLDMGNYQAAEKSLLRAQQLSEMSGNEGETYGNILEALGQLYVTMGNHLAAEEKFIQALKIFGGIPGEQSHAYMISLGDLGVLYERMGELEKAESIQRRALSIKKSIFGVTHVEYGVGLANLSAISRKQAKYDTARVLLDQALAISAKAYGKESTTYCLLLSNQAGVHDDLEKYDEGERLHLEAIAISKKLLPPLHLQSMMLINNLAFHYTNRGQLLKAEPLFIQSASLNTTLIQNLFPGMSDVERQRFTDALHLNLQNFEAFCIKRAKTNPAILEHLYNSRLITKGMLLNSSSKVRKNIMESGDRKLISLFNEWQDLKNALAKSYQVTTSEQSANKINEQQVLAKINSLEKELSARSQAFASPGKPIEWKDVQQHLTKGEGAVEILRIVVVDSTRTKTTINYSALCLTPEMSSPLLVSLTDGDQLERRFFSFYRNAIDTKSEDNISYKNFWKPIADALPGISKIYLSTDGVFNRINVNTLRNPKTGKVVIDETEIQLVGNTRDIVELKQQRAVASVVLFGNPDYRGRAGNADERPTSASAKSRGASYTIEDLPGTKIEVEQIGRIASNKKLQVSYYLSSEATESTLKEIKDPDVLHIATHGYFFADDALQDNTGNYFGMNTTAVTTNPLFRSGLLFTGSQGAISGTFTGLADDGVLTAYEAMNLNLDKTKLVVLSACETGLGVQQNGEGIYGLQRAFQISGARSILMSLWKVDDQVTKELMISFYSHWLDGMPIQTAFRKSQIEVRSKFPATSQWGAFVLLGN